MRLYKVATNDVLVGYAGSAKEATDMRMTYFDANRTTLKKKDIAVSPIDVPTKKAEFVKWLNAM